LSNTPLIKVAGGIDTPLMDLRFDNVPFGRTQFAPTLWTKSVTVGAQSLRPPIDWDIIPTQVPYQGGQGGSAPPLSRGAGGISTPLMDLRFDNVPFGRTQFAPTLWTKSVTVGAQSLRPPIDWDIIPTQVPYQGG
jgi:hypothetical protein